MIHTLACQDTFNLWQGQVEIQYYNNNSYVQTWEWNFGDGGSDSIQNPLHIYSDTGTYNVSITVSDNGCIKTAEKTIVVVINSGIADYSPEEVMFNIYPNPTTGDITAEFIITDDMYLPELIVNGSFGEEKFKKKVAPGFNRIDIPSTIWPAGWYIAGLYSNNRQLVVKKFVKE